MHIINDPIGEQMLKKLANEIKEHGMTVVFYRAPQVIIQHLNRRTDVKDELVFEEYGIENLETGALKRTKDEFVIYVKGKKPQLHGDVDWDNEPHISKDPDVRFTN